MNRKMLTATSYPQSSPKKDSRKLLAVAFLLVIIIVSAGVIIYLATRPSSTCTPTPTPMPTDTANPTPSGTNPAANWRAGSWANYTIRNYASGALSSESTARYAIEETTYNGTPCWLMTYDITLNQASSAVRTLMTYWISKSTFEGIHMKAQMYMHGNLMSEDEEDLTPGKSGGIPDPIEMTTVTSYETITVPAGTFNCGKITATTTEGTATSWANSSIPILGLVKMESTSGDAVAMTQELTSYHVG